MRRLLSENSSWKYSYSLAKKFRITQYFLYSCISTLINFWHHSWNAEECSLVALHHSTRRCGQSKIWYSIAKSRFQKFFGYLYSNLAIWHDYLLITWICSWSIVFLTHSASNIWIFACLWTGRIWTSLNLVHDDMWSVTCEKKSQS